MQRPTGRTILTAPSTGTQSTPAEPLYSHRSNKSAPWRVVQCATLITNLQVTSDVVLPSFEEDEPHGKKSFGSSRPPYC
jgi:hypothetical protein